MGFDQAVMRGADGGFCRAVRATRRASERGRGTAMLLVETLEAGGARALKRVSVNGR